MSKVVSPALKAHMAQGSTTLATLLTMVSRRTGEKVYFTDHDTPIPYLGNVYEPYVGYTPSAINTNINMAVDNQSIRGIVSSDTVSQKDIDAGLFDFGDVSLIVVNYEDLTMGSMNLLSGKFGESDMTDGEFNIELRGIAQLLQQRMGENYLVPCAAEFGDSRCKIDASDPDYTKPFTVAGAVSGDERRAFGTEPGDLDDPDGYFTGGVVTFDSLASNPNAVMDVKIYTQLNGIIELYEPLPYDILAGDAGTVVVGCPKTLTACKTKFKVNNVYNHRGFPYLTGATTLLRGAG